MTRHQYIMLADALAEVRRASMNQDERRAVSACAHAIAAALARDIPKFDSARFLKNAGVRP